MAHTLQKKKQAIEIIHKEIQSLDLLDKNFKSAIIKMSKVLNKIMSKKIKCEHNVSPKREFV